MKTAWPVAFVVAAIALLYMTQANSDESGKKAPAPTVYPERAKAPGEVRDDNSLKMKLVWCPPGTFTMGSPPTELDPDGEHPENEIQVEVTLTKGYWLGKYEVTQSEWKQVMKTEPWKIRTTSKEGADFPATFVSWTDAMGFCRKLTERERQAGRLSIDWEYTLPTEAQLERACRARTETRFSFGERESMLGDYAWFIGNWKRGEENAQKVGQKKANPWGLHDMHGNVYEWCRDGYAEKLSGGRDPE